MSQEATRIDATVAALAGFTLALPDIEPIVVDDDCTEGTARLCKQALVRHRSRQPTSDFRTLSSRSQPARLAHPDLRAECVSNGLSLLGLPLDSRRCARLSVR
jgi:hypothetical protein